MTLLETSQPKRLTGHQTGQWDKFTTGSKTATIAMTLSIIIVKIGPNNSTIGFDDHIHYHFTHIPKMNKKVF